MNKRITFFTVFSIIILLIVVSIGAIVLVGEKKTTEINDLGGGGTRDFAYFSTYYVADSVGQLLEKGAGVLGRVTITNSPENAFTLYNATTTNVNLRVLATSSLAVLASFPASATVGTYDFDAAFSQGLIFVPDGTIGTTTILYK